MAKRATKKTSVVYAGDRYSKWMIGDEVQLKSGSPRMLVVDYNKPKEVVVSWRNSEGCHEFRIHEDGLKKHGS
jgi:uncharacterized protein YodC (DUF2158 family)